MLEENTLWKKKKPNETFHTASKGEACRLFAESPSSEWNRESETEIRLKPARKSPQTYPEATVHREQEVEDVRAPPVVNTMQLLNDSVLQRPQRCGILDSDWCTAALTVVRLYLNAHSVSLSFL